MNLKLFMNLERHAFYIVILSLIGILWYVAIWGLFEDSVEYLHTKYKISRRSIYISVVSAILLFILIHPQILYTL
jgi:hypothetical protein